MKPSQKTKPFVTRESSKSQLQWNLIPTEMGHCGVCWTSKGLKGFYLPFSDRTEAEMKMKKIVGGKPSEPPAWIRSLEKRVQKYFRGVPQEFTDLPLDFDGIPEFATEVYRSTLKLTFGKISTYGEMAKSLGRPGAARAVGTALGKNPWGLIVPCHRVLAANKRLGGFSAPGGIATKEKMLWLEGISVRPIPSLKDSATFEEGKKHLKKVDRDWAQILARFGKWEFDGEPLEEPLDALLKAIVYQQLSPKAAATIYSRVRALWSEGPLSAQDILKTPVEKMRGAGLSGAKVSYVQDLARAALAGELPSLEEIVSLPDEEIIRRLTKVKGIGRWSAEMFLIFRLGRCDVWPLQDLAVKNAFTKFLGLKSLDSKKMEALSMELKPYRSVAALAMWRSLSL